MGLFGPSKIKITPSVFIKAQLDQIFSANFTEAETKGFAELLKEHSIMQSVSLDKYLLERLNIIYNLFQIAWDRTVPYSVFIEHSIRISSDPRVQAINSGTYDRLLSRAQEAGRDTFGFATHLFLAQIIPQNATICESDYSRLYEIYGTDFTRHYMSFEALIKRYKFTK